MPLGRRTRSESKGPTDAVGELERPRRYLVLGSEGHGRRVASYRWDRLPGDLNVADYDVVILNFAAFVDETLAQGMQLDRMPSRESMARLLFSPSSEVIVIGDPRTLIGQPRSEDPRTPPWWEPRKRADYWLPQALQVESDSGTSYSVIDDEWQTYFEACSGWRWILVGEPRFAVTAGTYLEPVTSKANALAVRLEPIAETRYSKPISVAIRMDALRLYRAGPAGGESAEGVLSASPIVWLPAPDRITPAEAIDLILRDRYGIASEAWRPEWASGYVLPNEETLRAQIARIEHERRLVEERLAAARERAAEAARPTLLLYEKGKDVLEPIVRATLRELGAGVEEPEAEGIEDGTLIRPEGRAVLEIKGRNGPIKLDDVRQVVQWAADARGRDGVAYKGVIVGNPHCDIAPERRPAPLAPNALTYAENSDVAFVSTVQIYEALREKQSGEFQAAAFWSAVFDSRGPARLPVPEVPDEEPQ